MHSPGYTSFPSQRNQAPASFKGFCCIYPAKQDRKTQPLVLHDSHRLLQPTEQVKSNRHKDTGTKPEEEFMRKEQLVTKVN